ncbi:methylcobalamin:coenzyme M methyltransferase [Peptococcaceae bacterium CEB3]|nr:methylcobalamin:coenzyme M methyltransferase [Peptococcaceae bacterium CEB3]
MLNSEERLVSALRGNAVDRVPVVLRMGISLLEEPNFLGFLGERPSETLQATDLGKLIALQEELGLDPVLYPHWRHGFTIEDFPDTIFRWPEEALRNWRIERKIDKSTRTIHTVIRTPAGDLTASTSYDRYQKWALEYPIKEEADLDRLMYLPDPHALDLRYLSNMMKEVQQRGIVMVTMPSIWDQALHFRGLDRLLFDVYDRPDWLRSLLLFLKNYTVKAVDTICAKTKVHAIMYNGSYISLGSPAIYDEFLAAYDKEIIAAIHKNGSIAEYHDCGKTVPYLERMINTGVDAIETLTSPRFSAGGDIELEDARKMAGGRVTLVGGFDERVLDSDSLQEVETEVKRCLNAAYSNGGRYILYPAGQVFKAKRENIQAMVDTARSMTAR